MWPFEVSEEERARRQAEAEAELQRLKEEDAADEAAASSWLPPVAAGEFGGGRFVSYEDLLLRADMIESIEIRSEGCRPMLVPDFGGADWACPAQPSVIAITLTTGRVHKVYASRHRMTRLLVALRAAWTGTD